MEGQRGEPLRQRRAVSAATVGEQYELPFADGRGCDGRGKPLRRSVTASDAAAGSTRFRQVSRQVLVPGSLRKPASTPTGPNCRRTARAGWAYSAPGTCCKTSLS